MARFAVLVEAAGYGLLLTPVLEHVGVFHRGIGEGSEVVGKEMYVFEDRDGQVLALRPEGTAPVARAFVQHHPVPPWKAWYVAPSFRHERPQHGRYRQHFQLGVEALGPADPDLDVEVVALAHDFFEAFGLRDVTLKLHSMGDGVCRPGYVALLGAYLAERADQLCPAHRARHLREPPARARLQERGVPGGHRGRAPPARPPLRRMPRPLRAGAGRARLARRGLRDRPPSRPRLRLLHPHHVRVRLRRTRRGAERDRGRGALRRARRDAGRPAHARHRLRDRDRARPARLRRRGRLPDGGRAGGAPAARLRDRHGRRAVGGRAHGGAAPSRAAGRPGLRRAFHEVPDQVGRPLRRLGGAGGRPPGARGGRRGAATACASDEAQRDVPREAVVGEVRRVVENTQST